MSSYSVRKIAFGRDHCLLLFSNGQLGAFGDNEGGQLGIDPRANPKRTKNFFCFTPEIPIQDKYYHITIIFESAFSITKKKAATKWQL